MNANQEPKATSTDSGLLLRRLLSYIIVFTVVLSIIGLVAVLLFEGPPPAWLMGGWLATIFFLMFVAVDTKEFKSGPEKFIRGHKLAGLGVLVGWLGSLLMLSESIFAVGSLDKVSWAIVLVGAALIFMEYAIENLSSSHG